MPMRLLIYVAREYETQIKLQGMKIHSGNPHMFPAPEFYVVDATGRAGDEMKLSDMFVTGANGFLELCVKIIHKGETDIDAYLDFIEDVESKRAMNWDAKDAVRYALSQVDDYNKVSSRIKQEGLAFKEVVEMMEQYESGKAQYYKTAWEEAKEQWEEAKIGWEETKIGWEETKSKRLQEALDRARELVELVGEEDAIKRLSKTYEPSLVKELMKMLKDENA